MEKVLLFSKASQPARTNQQQLKFIVNLPVRVISDNKVMDILPIATEEVEALPVRFRRRLNFNTQCCCQSFNDMILFFQGCKLDDLVNAFEVATIYQVSYRIIRTWAEKGILIRYRITNTLSVYKRSELPTIAAIYGSSYDNVE
jgi:hypothetical protein